MLGPPAVLAAATQLARVQERRGSAPAPAALSASEMAEVEAAAGDAAEAQLLLTHRSAKLSHFARAYAALIAQVRGKGAVVRGGGCRCSLCTPSPARCSPELSCAKPPRAQDAASAWTLRPS